MPKTAGPVRLSWMNRVCCKRCTGGCQTDAHLVQEGEVKNTMGQGAVGWIGGISESLPLGVIHFLAHKNRRKTLRGCGCWEILNSTAYDPRAACLISQILLFIRVVELKLN